MSDSLEEILAEERVGFITNPCKNMEAKVIKPWDRLMLRE
ncbi:hypothetical protein [Candidatus Enterovibrio escicola]